MDQPHDKKVVWDSQIESYKVVSNPEWDIENELGIYSSLVSKGLSDEFAIDIVSMFNTTRPVYPCYCHTGHQALAYGFNPCPCAKCEKMAKLDGHDTSQPSDHIQLHKNTVHVVGDMLKQQLSQINSILAQDNIYISEDDFKMFQSLLREYGETEKSWSEVVDQMLTDPKYESDSDKYNAIAAVLEYFWILFVLNNPVATGHRYSD